MTSYSAQMSSVSNQLNLQASDDAKAAFIISLEDILTGRETLAFGHSLILEDYYQSVGDTDIRFNYITKLSMVRNIRLILKVNEKIKKNKEDGVIGQNISELHLTEEMHTLYKFRDLLYKESSDLGIDLTQYCNEELDLDDVEQCTNGSERSRVFNFDQQLSEPGKASDNVKILRGLDGDFLVVIKREFGPGRGCCAFAGGLLEEGETNKECALREGDEEVQMSLKGLQYKSLTYEMNQLHTYWWDPRARFPYGMINGALVTLMDFGDVNIF